MQSALQVRHAPSATTAEAGYKRPKHAPKTLFDPPIVRRAVIDAVRKLNPRHMARNPVMFVVEAGSVVATILLIGEAIRGGANLLFNLQITLWIWFTVIFANFAEAMAEGRGKAQADTLRRSKTETAARRLSNGRGSDGRESNGRDGGRREERIAATALRKGDIVVCEAGDIIPGDGDVIEGIASVDESAITGESAPVIRETGDRSAVTGGTKVLSDRIVVRITSNPGEAFIDRMISLVEGAKRQKTPNEIALTILLAGSTIIFLLAVATLVPFAAYGVRATGAGTLPSIFLLSALLVCLIPTTIGGLLSAIGIAGMDRVMQHNVLAMSGKAVEAAGDVDVLLLDKTGTITLGNRRAVAFHPAPGIDDEELAEAAQLASLSDETPEGRSIVVLAKERYGLREVNIERLGARFVPFTAQTRMSGVDLDGDQIRKGAADAIESYVHGFGGVFPSEINLAVSRISKKGGTPLVVAERERVLGAIELRDVVKGGIRERFSELRRMGIKTVMITGDNPLTAAAIAAEAGVDDFLAQATPEAKLTLIRKHQEGGRLVAMTGDGTNDAPALAQADVAVAMNSGTQAAKEAGNMVDLDSNPTKLLEIVHIGKQLLMTRGSLTTFSIANDLSKYFCIIPAMFAVTYPMLGAINFLNYGPGSAHTTANSAVLAAVIFNALIIIALIPLALRGVAYKPMGASAVLRRNLLLYGAGGVIVPFPAIWLIDRVLNLLHLA